MELAWAHVLRDRPTRYATGALVKRYTEAIQTAEYHAFPAFYRPRDEPEVMTNQR